MTKVDIYNSDYTSLNHSYIQIYDTYQKLLEVDDCDEDVLQVLGQILMAFNPVLDQIKSEMTVKTRFKDGSSDIKEEPKKNNGPVILHGDFSGE